MILTGTKLQHALNSTAAPIRLFQGARYVRDLTSDEIPLLIADHRYQFEGRVGKVRLVRQLDPSAIIVMPWKAKFEHCWLNSEAAVLRFHGEPA